MDNSEKENSPEFIEKPDLEQEEGKSKLWGVFYHILGMMGLSASIYSGFYDFQNIVPLYGTIIAGVLVAALSILIIIYGYRIIRRDL